MGKWKDTMKMHIALIAACIGTLALIQADIARAAYAGTLESKSEVMEAKSAVRIAAEKDSDRKFCLKMCSRRYDGTSANRIKYMDCIKSCSAK